MDPQTCVSQIVGLVCELDNPRITPQKRDQLQQSLETAFDNLAMWLKNGGFPPSASGAVFGKQQVRVGYTGKKMSAPRFAQRPRTSMKSSAMNYRFAIEAKDPTGEDLTYWVFREYHQNTRDLLNEWELMSAFHCPTCHSEDAVVSPSTPLKCTLCDVITGPAVVGQ